MGADVDDEPDGGPVPPADPIRSIEDLYDPATGLPW
jgi:hypothetical protein